MCNSINYDELIRREQSKEMSLLKARYPSVIAKLLDWFALDNNSMVSNVELHNIISNTLKCCIDYGAEICIYCLNRSIEYMFLLFEPYLWESL